MTTQGGSGNQNVNKIPSLDLATALAITEGGTGATTASGAITNLGLTGFVAYGADNWNTVNYVAARDGVATSNGFTLSGSTEGLGSDGGIQDEAITATTSATGYIALNPGWTSASTWEVRVEYKVTANSTNQNQIVIRDGTRRLSLYFTATTIADNDLGSFGNFNGAIGEWRTVTVRKNGDTKGMVETWVGPYLMDTRLYAGLTADATGTSLRVGKQVTTGTNEVHIRSVLVRLNSLNEAPPSYTFRGTLAGR